MASGRGTLRPSCSAEITVSDLCSEFLLACYPSEYIVIGKTRPPRFLP